jgi:hypothetical protein
MSRPNLPPNVEQPAQFRVQETCYNCHITLAEGIPFTALRVSQRKFRVWVRMTAKVGR